MSVTERRFLYAAYVAWIPQLAWFVIPAVGGRPAVEWCLENALVPIWAILAGTAAYYLHVCSRLVDARKALWTIGGALDVAATIAVFLVCGWEAAITVAIAIAALVPFGVSWAATASSLLGIESVGGRLALVLYLSSTPLILFAAAVAAGAGAMSLSIPDFAGACLWGTVAFALLGGVVPALLLSRRARARARRHLAEQRVDA